MTRKSAAEAEKREKANRAKQQLVDEVYVLIDAGWTVANAMRHTGATSTIYTMIREGRRKVKVPGPTPDILPEYEALMVKYIGECEDLGACVKKRGLKDTMRLVMAAEYVRDVCAMMCACACDVRLRMCLPPSNYLRSAQRQAAAARLAKRRSRL
jgi:hypothetical protein